MSAALRWLTEVAPPWVELRSPAGANPLTCVARVALPDGETVDYGLSVQALGEWSGEQLSVRESGSGHLPRSCLERHINVDGSFCLGFGPTAPETPRDRPTAARWWSLIHGYLDLQNLAGLTGRWPRRHAWPHGPVAATTQLLLEAAESSAPPAVLEAIERGAVRFKAGTERLAHPNRRCPCGSGEAMRRCHGGVARLILTARAAVAQADTNFSALFSGQACCGTMRDCPLRMAPPTGESQT